MSVGEVVSFVAGSAVTISSMFSALIRDGDADVVSIEDPSVRAGQANSVVPVPGGTSKIRRLNVVVSREDTGSVDEVVSLEA